MKQEIIIYATESARKNEGKTKSRKKKINECQVCEIKIPEAVIEKSYFTDEITEEDLK